MGNREPSYPMGAQGAGPGPYGGYPQASPLGHGYPMGYAPAPPTSASNYADSFCRGFILCVCLLMLGGFLLSIVGMVIMSGKLPEFKLVYLQLDELGTSGGQFTGEWEARLKIGNPNEATIYFETYYVELLYEREQLGQSPGTRFNLKGKEVKQMNSKASATPKNPIHLDTHLLEQMGKERGGGSLTVSPRVWTLASFGDDGGERTFRLEANCDDVKLQFTNGNTGIADINPDNPVHCKLE